MKFVKPLCMPGYPELEDPSKSTLTPSRFLAAIALIVLVTAAWVALGVVTIELIVALSNALMTTTTRSPAAWAALMVFTRFWLFHPVQPLVVVLMLPSALMSRPK